jgi:hypothetical protein
MVQLATQLVQRRAGKYESGDLEDRYETRLRTLIDAKLKGEGIDLEEEVPQAAASNVVDLMAALKKSLGQVPAETRTRQSHIPGTETPLRASCVAELPRLSCCARVGEDCPLPTPWAPVLTNVDYCQASGAAAASLSTALTRRHLTGVTAGLA